MASHLQRTDGGRLATLWTIATTLATATFNFFAGKRFSEAKQLFFEVCLLAFFPVIVTLWVRIVK